MKFLAVLPVAAVALAACSSADVAQVESPTPGTSASSSAGSDPPDDAGSPEDASGIEAAVALPQIETSPKEDGPSALDPSAASDLPDPLVDPGDLRSGGPPPDGIPALDAPTFVRAEAVINLGDAEPVLSLEIDGEVRAYPVRVLIWHEIVNDSLGNVPVAVTYCPLCNSALAFDRRVDHRVLSFGTSGMLFNSDLVMYDRQTESLWPQLEGRAVAGRLTGTELDRFPIQTVAWADFATAHPDAWVLSDDTGYDREYGTNPYEGYDDENAQPFLFDGEAPQTLPVKARVIGLGDGANAMAVALDRLAADGVMRLTVAGDEVVLLFAPGLTSALDSENLSDSKDVGATGAFVPVIDGRPLTFTADGGVFTDAETGSTWDILGRAVAGPLTGEELTPVDHVDTFWFAWSAFQPRTDVLK